MAKINSDLLSKLVKHLEVYGFVKCLNHEDTLRKLSFGPAGELLRETIKREWVYSNVIAKELSVFTFTSPQEPALIPSLRDAFQSGKTLTNFQVPFGLAEMEREVSPSWKGEGEAEVLVPQSSTAMRYHAFLGPPEAEQYFYRFQQERKRWWRKFSLDPGKFSIAETESEEGRGPSALIVAEFPWGRHVLEEVHYLAAAPFNNISREDENIFSVRYMKKRCLPHVVTSEINLDYAAFSYMCDAFSTKKGRVIMKFHRKLAPFKFSVAANPAGDEINQRLLDLGELLCLELKRAGLPSLLPVKGEFARRKLDLQLMRSDSLGVPYTLVLGPESLDTGVITLYSRDTTLQEQVHISKMAEYGQLLMKNY